jgi:hypothetical protein
LKIKEREKNEKEKEKINNTKPGIHRPYALSNIKRLSR